LLGAAQDGGKVPLGDIGWLAMPAGQPSAASKAEVEKPSVLQNRPHIGWG